MVRMACCRLSLHRIHASWRDLHVLGWWNRPGLEAGRKIRHSCFSTRFHHRPLTLLSKRGFWKHGPFGSSIENGEHLD
ncbi:hypothetical protein B296_00051279 [Ensete ventricosum]|uniref:Uncharacterized protein n=1 Tax=Ensete ventricosum TaxID=4639 RepID=A0A426YHB8_ENSVE|nr:hypothetical protein B296_00051279 [Ensete ventricosum]